MYQHLVFFGAAGAALAGSDGDALEADGPPTVDDYGGTVPTPEPDAAVSPSIADGVLPNTPPDASSSAAAAIDGEEGQPIVSAAFDELAIISASRDLLVSVPVAPAPAAGADGGGCRRELEAVHLGCFKVYGFEQEWVREVLGDGDPSLTPMVRSGPFLLPVNTFSPCFPGVACV